MYCNHRKFRCVGLYDEHVVVFHVWAIPSMLLALVLCFDHRKSRGSENFSDLPLRKEDISSPKGFKYIWYGLAGYSIGLVTALAAGILTHSP
ncbi:Signal peptide peptidase-like 1 [Capsicum chinense]|nr:Signal peptide peptidase-like 1 [Capsicum chinense]